MAERKRLIDISLSELLIIWLKNKYERNKKSLERMTLANATNKAPEQTGVYELYLDDRLVYIGKAAGSLKDHFIDLYDGKKLISRLRTYQQIYENRDRIELKWYVIRDETKLLEKEFELRESFKPEWNRHLIVDL